MKSEQTLILVEGGVTNYENTIIVKKQAKELASTLSTFCLTLDCIEGVEPDADHEILLQAVSALTRIDGKLKNSVADQRSLLFAHMIADAEKQGK